MSNELRGKTRNPFVCRWRKKGSQKGRKGEKRKGKLLAFSKRPRFDFNAHQGFGTLLRDGSIDLQFIPCRS
jgi:hypothetical protein